MNPLRLLPVVLAAGVMGCDAPTATGVSAAPQTNAQVPVAQNAGPGPADVSPSAGGKLLREICVETLPDFKGARSRLAALPFVQNAKTGTYYHQRLDLSVKINSDRCSFVMAGRNLSEKSASEVLAVSNSNGKAFFRRSLQAGGKTYLGFAVEN